MERNSEQSLNRKRSLSIDVFRGITICVMVFVNIVGLFNKTPAWSKHAGDFGLTYVDLVAPFFIFALSLNYRLSFKRRKEKNGQFEAYLHFLRRYGALIGFGFLGAISFSSNGFLFSWGVLQTIGFAGIITLFFINLRIMARFIISIFFLIMHQILSYIEIVIDGIKFTISDLVLNSSNGGLIDGFGWAILMLMTTVIGELFENKEMIKILIFGILFLIVGVVLTLIFDISKDLANISYITLSIGLGCIFFCILWEIYENKELTHRKSVIFQPQGKNAFVLYAIHGILSIFTELLIPESIGWGIVLIIGFVNMVIIWLVAFILDRKKIYIII